MFQKNFQQGTLYVGRNTGKAQAEGLARACIEVVCLVGLRDSEDAPGRPPTAITHTGGNPTQEVANLLQTALAAYRVTLVGAAEMGARRRQPPFDPLRSRQALRLGDTDTGCAVTRTNPVQREAVRIRTGGRSEMNGVTLSHQVGC